MLQFFALPSQQASHLFRLIFKLENWNMVLKFRKTASTEATFLTKKCPSSAKHVSFTSLPSTVNPVTSLVDESE